MAPTHAGQADPNAGPAASTFNTVTQLARELGVTARTIRFYEDKGLISPKRAGSTRVYTARDRARMILILRGKRLGFSLREIKEYLDLYDVDHTQAEQLRALISAVGKRLCSLREQSEALAQTITELVDVQSQAESAFAQLPAARRKQADFWGEEKWLMWLLQVMRARRSRSRKRGRWPVCAPTTWRRR